MSKITNFFSPAKSLDEIIPPEWKTSPLPSESSKEKRPVGRPKKRKLDVICLDEEESVPERKKDSGLYVERSDLGQTTPVRGKYKRYTVPEKLEIVKLAESFGVTIISERYHVPASTICTWKTRLRTEKSDKSEKEVLQRKEGSGRVLTYGREIEEQLLSWIVLQRDLQLPVSRECIKKQGLALIKTSNADFKASNGWLDKFMKRNDLATRKPTSFSQKLPADLEQRLFVFYKNLKERREKCEFDEEMVVNMDEVPMVFEVVARNTVDGKGKRDVKLKTAGGEKRHFTVVLCVAANGTTLPAMVIFKGKRQPKVTKLPKGWIVVANDTAWMREALMLRWINEILRPYTKRRPALLVMDSFSAHATDAVQERLSQINCQSAIIPGGCTCKAQPLDVVLNKPFKDQLRKRWIEHTRASGTEPSKIPTKDKLVEWIEDGMKYFTSQMHMVQKSFKVTGITNALSGTEDSMVGCEEILNDFLGDEDSGCDDDFWGFEDGDVFCDTLEDPFADCI